MSNVKCQFLFFFSFLFCVKIVFMNPYFSLAGILTIINPHRFSSSTLKKYKFLSGFTIWDLSFWKKRVFLSGFIFWDFLFFFLFLKNWFFEWFCYMGFWVLCVWLVFFFEGTWCCCCCCCWVVEFRVEECDSNSNKSMEISLLLKINDFLLIFNLHLWYIFTSVDKSSGPMCFNDSVFVKAHYVWLHMVCFNLYHVGINEYWQLFIVHNYHLLIFFSYQISSLWASF